VKLSVLVVTFNRPDDLLDLLQSIACQDELDGALEEVLILDNGTTSDYAEAWAFADAHPELKIRVIRSGENLGATAGKNLLMREAQGEVFLVLDDDVVLPNAGDVATLARIFDKEIFRDANTGIVQVRVVYHDTKEIQKSAYPHKRRAPDSEDGPFLTSFFAGGATLMRKDAVEKAGPYPEEFSIYMEEYDLSYRVIDAGFSIGYDPSVTIEHKESRHGRLVDHAKLRRQWTNKTIVAWRYLPLRYVITTAFMWNLEYIRRVRGHPADYFRAWRHVLTIPFREKRSPLGTKALRYLRTVDARLSY
jgi:GT2 family glycosyltransferase